MTPSEKKSMKTMERELEDMREQHGELKKKLDEAKAQRIDNLVKKGVSAFLGCVEEAVLQKRGRRLAEEETGTAKYCSKRRIDRHYERYIH